MSQSGWGKGLAQLNQDFLAQYQAQNEQKIAIMRAQAEEQERLQREAEEQARLAEQAQVAAQQQAQQAGVVASAGQVSNPLMDENSNFRKYLAANNIDLDLYMGKDRVDEKGNVIAKGMTKIERDREIVTPFIEQMWEQEVRINPELQMMSSDTLAKVKEDFANQRKRAYGANFDEDYEKNVEGTDWWGSLGNSVARGSLSVAQQGTSVWGGLTNQKDDDNWIYNTAKTVTGSVQGGLESLDDEQRKQLKEYANRLIANKELDKLAQLVKDYPSLAVDLGGNMAGAVAATVVGTKAASKGLTKAGNALGPARGGKALLSAGKFLSKKGLASVILGAIGAGATAYETAKEDGVEDGAGTKLATLGGLALGGVTTHIMNRGGAPTVDVAIENALTRGAPSALSESAKKAAQQVLDKNASGTGLGNVGRYGYNLGKGAIKSGSKEYSEEFLQSASGTLSGHAADGKLTEKEVNDTLERADTDGAIGFAFGSGLGLARNGFNRYGSADAVQLAQEQKAEAQAQAAAQKAKDAQIKQGVWQDANGNPLPDFTQEDIDLAKFYAQRNADLPNLETEYGKDAEAEYTADYDDAYNATQFNDTLNKLRDEIVSAGKGGSVQGVPKDIVDATNELSNLGTAQAKLQKLQEWAKNTGDAELEARAGALAGKVVADYDYDSSGNYVNTKADHGTSVETAIQKWQNELTGKTTPITDLNAELDALAQSQPDLADAINRYKKAVANNHHKTAGKLATDFERAIDKKIRKNQQNPQTPAVDPALRTALNKSGNGRAVDILVKAMGRRASGNMNKWRHSQDPVAELRNIANNIGAIDHTVLTDTEADEVQAHLNNVLDQWEQGNFVDIGDTTNNLIAKVRNTVK